MFFLLRQTTQKVNRWPLTHFCWGHMCNSTQGSLSDSHMRIQWLFFKNFYSKGQWPPVTPRWLLTPLLLRLHVLLYQRINVSKSHANISKNVDTVTIFQKTLKSQWALDDLWPFSVEVACATLPKDHYVKSHGNTSKYVDKVIIFF